MTVAEVAGDIKIKKNSGLMKIILNLEIGSDPKSSFGGFRRSLGRIELSPVNRLIQILSVGRDHNPISKLELIKCDWCYGS